MPDILHQITVKAAPDAVFAAVTTAEGLRSWWTQSSRAEPREGSVSVFGFVGGSVEFHFRVDELADNKRAAWTCVAAPKVPDEWVDTRVTFNLEPTDDGGTVVGFSHTGWESVEGAYAQCNTVWGELMHRLRDYVEGNPRGPYFEG